MIHSSAQRAFCGFLSAHPCRGLLIALSGGADSVALLHLAQRMQAQFGYRLEALHVHHGIRGAEADRDRDFCHGLCASLEVPLTVVCYDIPALSAADKTGLEETARNYRYRALADHAAARDLDAIATAHTATDNLETALLQLTRGVASLRGIPQKREIYIRPLLSVTREEILAYLGDNHLSYVEDSTNASCDYSRNLIRHRVTPVLRTLNPRVEEAFGRAITRATEDDDYLQSLAAPYALRGDAREMAALPAPLRSRALVARCKQLGIGSLADLHITALTELVRAARPHSALSLPGGTVAIEEGYLVKKADRPSVDDWSIPLSVGENRLPDESFLFIDPTGGQEFEKKLAASQNIYKLLINGRAKFATIDGVTVARSRLAGDAILSGGMHRSVKKLFCDAHIPPAKRPLIPVICDREGILWIPGIDRRRDGTDCPAPSAHTLLIWYEIQEAR